MIIYVDITYKPRWRNFWRRNGSLKRPYNSISEACVNAGSGDNIHVNTDKQPYGPYGTEGICFKVDEFGGKVPFVKIDDSCDFVMTNCTAYDNALDDEK